jgi:hypothetical protein
MACPRCRPTWYTLAVFACIVLLPAESRRMPLTTEVRVVGTVARVLPTGFEIMLYRESAIALTALLCYDTGIDASHVTQVGGEPT